MWIPFCRKLFQAQNIPQYSKFDLCPRRRPVGQQRPLAKKDNKGSAFSYKKMKRKLSP